MLNNRFRSRTLWAGILSAVALSYGVSSLSAQEAPNKIGIHIGTSDWKLSGYDKISASLGAATFHVTGKHTLFEFQEKDRAVHQLHADDIKLVSPGIKGSGEFSGNLHYTMTQPTSGVKLIEGTADRALYRQADAKPSATNEGAGVTLLQAHISLYQNGVEAASLDSGKVAASLQDDLVIGTGAVHIAAHVAGRQAEVSAEKVVWNRRTNLLEVSGKVHFAYSEPNKANGSIDADHMKIDLKTLQIDIQ